MKLVTVEDRNAPTRRFLAALLSESELVDLGAAHAASGGAADVLPATMLAFLEAGAPALAAARAALEFARANPGKLAPGGHPLAWRRDELRFLPAVPRPGKIFHTSVNFRSHKAEVATGFSSDEWKRQDWGSFITQHPTGFLQAPSLALVGTDSRGRASRGSPSSSTTSSRSRRSSASARRT